jgi:hypothetical protein
MTARESGVLELDKTEFEQTFPRRGFKVRHHLCNQPAFELQRLVQLAQRLPEDQVEHYTGKVSVNQDSKKHPRNGLSIVETVRRIEECGSWMVLKKVQVDPEYGKLLRMFLGEVYQEYPSITGMHREEAFIFISSPNSITPYHLDEEHNFLLQVRGSKEVNMWDPNDRTVVPEQQAEKMLQIWHGEDYHRSMPYKNEFQERATVFSLSPGEGLHFPVGAPHWVKNGPEVSVSFSVTFRSHASERQAILYFINRKIRKMGLEPVPPGQSVWRDSLKYGAFQAGRRAAGAAAGSWFKRNQNRWA